MSTPATITTTHDYYLRDGSLVAAGTKVYVDEKGRLCTKVVDPCYRCSGTGVVRPWGECFRCRGAKGSVDHRLLYTEAQAAKLVDAKMQHAERKQEERENERVAREKARRDATCERLNAMDGEARSAFAWALEFDAAHPIAKDIAAKVERFTPSEKQIALVVKLYREFVAPKADVTPCPSGRTTITGTVATLKWVENDFGRSLKMLVVDDRGFKVWGTCPAAISNVEVQDRVTFTAAVTPKQGEAGFGFYSRPTQARAL